MGAVHGENFTEALYKLVNVGILRGNYLRDSRVSYSEDATERSYRIYNKRGREVVSFRARPLPGCCGVLVVYYLRPQNQPTIEANKKVFQETLELIRKAASTAKYGLVLLTQTFGCSGYEVLLGVNKAGFVSTSTNWKTRNKVCTFLLETEKPEGYDVKPTASFSGE